MVIGLDVIKWINDVIKNNDELIMGTWIIEFSLIIIYLIKITRRSLEKRRNQLSSRLNG